VPKIMKIDWE